MAQLVNPIQVLPGSSLELATEWKIVRIGVIDPSIAGNVYVTLAFRDKSAPSYSFFLISDNIKHLDCSVVKSIFVTKASPQGVNISPGIPYQTSDSPLGYNNTPGLIQPKLGFTPWRLLELIAQVSGSESSLIVDESVAAGGTGSGTYTPYRGTDKALFVGGISGDSLGTSPHDSYITVTDGNGKTVFKIRGALNTPFSILVHGLWGKISIAWSNGDSVAHWFLLNVYEVVA